jgi:biotin transport system substrate-specific component
MCSGRSSPPSPLPPPAFRLAAGALCAAATAVSAQLLLPLSTVPITMQTAATGLAGLILPPGEAAMAMAVYLGLGAAGLPVFAGFQGGFEVLLGPRGGFLWAFPAQAALTSWLFRRSTGLGTTWMVLSLAAGLVVLYLGGWLGLQLLAGFPARAAAAVLVPSLPFSVPKLVLTVLVYRAVAPRLPPPYRRLP